jgi:hypothetical protein
MPRHICIKETEIALLKQKLDDQAKKIDEIHSAILGNDDKPGLKTRVANIETAGKIGAAVIAIILSLVAFFKR